MKHIGDSGSANLGASISMLILSTVAVGLRLLFRLQAKQRPILSDVFVMFSLVFAFVWYGFNINYITQGPGPGTYDLTEIMASLQIGGLTWGNALMKMSYFGEIFFTAAISSAKLSILSLYQRIFGISVPFRRFNYFMDGVVVVLWIIFTFLFIFPCHPVSRYWNLAEQELSPGSCVEEAHLVFAFEFTNLIVDVVMLGMPPFMISQLNLPRDKKWSTCGILLLGGMVCIVSIVRLSYIWNPSSAENLKDLSATMITSDIQLGIALLCACLPTYTPLLRLFNRTLTSLKQSSARKTYEYPLKPSKQSTEGKYSNDHSSTGSNTICASGHSSVDYTTNADTREESRGMNSMSSYTAANDPSERV
ncbi:hypothetical protein N7478_009594 [Penicillium angulare]|uniref:uncharacterized protein n=1 Tax=Penicillium angulare TaxID=116970 RepID=UPI00253F893E|nr:uncharacterized protein N7478_009594 [Penicillium angulare]KAJ5266786.1 hypothetical protein N7478_009594 [Penicillium angulare]